MSAHATSIHFFVFLDVFFLLAALFAWLHHLPTSL